MFFYFNPFKKYLIQWFDMVVLFSSITSINKSNNNFNNAELVVFNFEANTPLFLSQNYYFLVDKLKVISKNTSTHFILSFYVKKLTRKYLCALRIHNGKIVNLFGECFSKKYLTIRVNNKKFTFLFYYYLYGHQGREKAKNSSFVIGLDDEPLENLSFLNKKFCGKLICFKKNKKFIIKN